MCTHKVLFLIIYKSRYIKFVRLGDPYYAKQIKCKQKCSMESKTRRNLIYIYKVFREALIFPQ